MTPELQHSAEYVAAWYVTKPVEVKAIRWREGENDDAVSDFSISSATVLWQRTSPGVAEVYDYLHETWVKHFDGQWLLRGTKSELYPCDDDVFRQKYRPLLIDGSLLDRPSDPDAGSVDQDAGPGGRAGRHSDGGGAND